VQSWTQLPGPCCFKAKFDVYELISDHSQMHALLRALLRGLTVHYKPSNTKAMYLGTDPVQAALLDAVAHLTRASMVMPRVQFLRCWS